MEKNDKKLVYASSDKPWMKYYKNYEETIDPKTNLTEYLRNKSEINMNNIATEYYGREISYDEHFYNVDIASTIFSELGVKINDNIMYLMPNVPESGWLWLGATQIGAISDFVDPRPDSPDIMANSKKVLELIKYEKANYIVTLDVCYLAMLKPIENKLKELGIENIILVGAADSMDKMGKFNYLSDVINYNNLKNIRNKDQEVQKLKWYQAVLQELNNMKQQSNLLEEAIKTSPLNIYKYQDLLRDVKNVKFTKVVNQDLINYIGHTSGTSGARPKPITSSNRNGISTLEQLKKARINFDIGDRVLHVLPYFAPFGAFDNYLLNISSGATNIDVPQFDISEFAYLIKKYKPNVIMATPAWIAALPSCSYLQNMDLSFIKTVIYGGDSMTAEDEEKANLFLRNHGSNAELEKGYGMSEFMGCGSYAQDDYNKLESIGIPLPDTTFAIVDPNVEDKLVELPLVGKKVVGELAVSGDSVTNGKLNNDVIVKHYKMNGDSYIRTRDIVEMDENGVFYHQARKDRSFARFDGYKVKPYEIEKEIMKNENVKYVCLVDYFDERKRGIMPICHVVLNNETTDEESIEIVKEIVYNQIIGNKNMSSRQIPSKFKVRKSMPISKNGKVDFNALKKEGLDGTEINVDVNETNLLVDNIDIYKNKKEKVRIR